VSVKDNRAHERSCSGSRLRETRNIMSSIETLAGDISQRQNRLLLDSTTDELTGLYNRRAFRQKAEKCFALSRRGVRVSVVALDMDYLKTINDRCGHAVGDRLLQALAECLRENTRSTDTVARLGGDEFLVMMVQCTPDSIVGWFDKLCLAFATRQQGIVPQGPQGAMRCSLSAGLSEVSPEDQDIEAVIGRADEALYNAKATGRGRISRWDGELDIK
jgi:diguanylate cyclase (GGDEF)-like protein